MGCEGGGLTEVQTAVARETVKCGGEIGEVLGRYSVSEEEFYGWLTGSGFPEYLCSLAASAATVSVAEVWAALTASAKNGNITAIKLYFDVLAKQNPKREAGGRGSEACGGDSAAYAAYAAYAAPSAEIEAVREAVFG